MAILKYSTQVDITMKAASAADAVQVAWAMPAGSTKARFTKVRVYSHPGCLLFLQRYSTAPSMTNNGGTETARDFLLDSTSANSVAVTRSTASRDFTSPVPTVRFEAVIVGRDDSTQLMVVNGDIPLVIAEPGETVAIISRGLITPAAGGPHLWLQVDHDEGLLADF